MPGHFNPPPGWPLSAGWEPPPDWEPDPTWPAAPAGWQFWVDDADTRQEPYPAAVPTVSATTWSTADEPMESADQQQWYPPGGHGVEQNVPMRKRPMVFAAMGGAVVALLGLMGYLAITFIHHHKDVAATQSNSGSPWTDVSTPSSATAPQPAAPVLDGAYRVDLNFAERKINGVLDPAANRTAWWAYRSVCKPTGCVATATMLDANLHQDTGSPASTDVFRYVGDHWEDPPTPYPGTVSCPAGGTAAVTMVGHSSWYPQSDGTFQGIQVADVQTPICGVTGEAFSVPFSATRIGDVPPDVTVADPASVGG